MSNSSVVPSVVLERDNVKDSVVESNERNIHDADDQHKEGNTAFQEKDFLKAIDKYSAALKLSMDGTNSHLYRCNRARAYFHEKNYTLCCEDCEASINLKPGIYGACKVLSYILYSTVVYIVANLQF